MKKFKFKIHGNNYDVDIKKHDGNKITLEINGSMFDVELEREIVTKKTPMLIQAAVAPPTRKESKIQKTFVKTANLAIKSPLPGVILSVFVKVGDSVKIGDKVMVLEAMKMENSILAEKDGIVSAVHVKVGDSCMQNDVLMEIE
jgi:biotin carboxyl carrier protein